MKASKTPEGIWHRREAYPAFCVPSWIRTNDPSIKSALLYTAELWRRNGLGLVSNTVTIPKGGSRRQSVSPIKRSLTEPC
jgi:hypothetical protein